MSRIILTFELAIEQTLTTQDMTFKSEYKTPRTRTGEILYECNILSPVLPDGTPDNDDYGDNPLGDI